MEKINLGVKNIVSTNIISENNSFLENILNSPIKDSVIPSCSIQENDSNWDIHFKKGEFSVDYLISKNQINYSNDPKEFAEWDILFLVRQTLERQLQQKGFLSLHSSSLELNNHAVLFFGESDSGKTSLVLESSKEGFGYLSNEWTIIDGKSYNIVAGTQPIISKRKVIDNFFPNINAPSFSPASHLSIYDPSDLFERREIVSHLKLLIIPKIKDSFFIFNARKNIVKNSLFESSSLYITGNYLMNNVSCASAPNLDTLECRENRANIINHLVDKYEPLVIEGLPKDILNYVKGKLI